MDKEKRTIPLPTQSEGEAINQLLITRTRSRTKLPGEDNSDYHDDCKLTFQEISSPLGATDPHAEKRVKDITMLVRAAYRNVIGKPHVVVEEREYTRYDHPFVVGLSEITELESYTREPTSEDYQWYTTLLQRYAA